MEKGGGRNYTQIIWKTEEALRARLTHSPSLDACQNSNATLNAWATVRVTACAWGEKKDTTVVKNSACSLYRFKSFGGSASWDMLNQETRSSFYSLTKSHTAGPRLNSVFITAYAGTERTAAVLCGWIHTRYLHSICNEWPCNKGVICMLQWVQAYSLMNHIWTNGQYEKFSTTQ